MSGSKYKCFVGVMASDGYSPNDACSMLVFPADDVHSHSVYRPHMVQANNLKELRAAIIKEIDEMLAISMFGYQRNSGMPLPEQLQFPKHEEAPKRAAVVDINMDCLTIECEPTPQSSSGTLFDLDKV